MQPQKQWTIPAGLERFAGQITDLDAHESIPAHRWVEEFGKVTEPLADLFKQVSTHSHAPDAVADETPITAESVWQTKGPRAPGAIDMRRRLEVMDFTHVSRQLIFPGGVGSVGAILYGGAESVKLLKALPGDPKSYGKKLIDAYNEWCMRSAKVSDRLRNVGLLIADTPEELVVEAKRLVAGGIRALALRSGTTPGGRSPAHPELDPLWSFFEDADVPCVLHLGSDSGFLSSYEWRNAPAFENYRMGEEFSMDPWTTSNMHVAPSNFVATMTMGGVFERHPRLRFACAEVNGQWIGPLAENLDMWYANRRRFGQPGQDPIFLPLKPSDYLRRNVRVAVFDFEAVDKYIRDFGLLECYCYASDFPHVEGGRDPMTKLADLIRPLGGEVMEKFFVTNGELILPA